MFAGLMSTISGQPGQGRWQQAPHSSPGNSSCLRILDPDTNPGSQRVPSMSLDLQSQASSPVSDEMTEEWSPGPSDTSAPWVTPESCVWCVMIL